MLAGFTREGQSQVMVLPVLKESSLSEPRNTENYLSYLSQHSGDPGGKRMS